MSWRIRTQRLLHESDMIDGTRPHLVTNLFRILQKGARLKVHDEILIGIRNRATDTSVNGPKMATKKRSFPIILLLFTIVPSQSIYCKVGYGQQIQQKNKNIDFWSKTLVRLFFFLFFFDFLKFILESQQWVRNCPDSTFCWNGSPVAHSEAAMVDLVGGDWNDDYWGDTGGFIYGYDRIAKINK